MKKNAELQSEIHFAKSRKQLLNHRVSNVYARTGRYMKIFFYFVLFTGIGIVFNSCASGYVATEPSYVEYSRPPRPHETYIWISGDWSWSNQNQVYVQKTGYWEKPRQGQTYVVGYWQTTPHGKSWSKGYWQKHNHEYDNHHDNDNR